MTDPSSEPIRILEIDLENVGQLRGGGGRGSGLYSVSVKLSRAPSSS